MLFLPKAEGCKVLYFSNETLENAKSLCVFGVMDIPRGLDIMHEMLQWLIPTYSVIVIKHKGDRFEYPALKFLQDFVVLNNYTQPVLYVHTKGAWYVRKNSACVRNMWKYEFTDPERRKLYLNAVAVEEPTLATPYQGVITGPRPGLPVTKYPIDVPWMNGWIANAAAIKLMQIAPSDNRYSFETDIYEGIHIIGIREKDVDTNVKESRDRMYSDIAKF